jgi:hypothetical protein
LRGAPLRPLPALAYLPPINRDYRDGFVENHVHVFQCLWVGGGRCRPVSETPFGRESGPEKCLLCR